MESTTDGYGYAYGQRSDDDASWSNGLQADGSHGAHDGHDGTVCRQPADERKANRFSLH